ncbi:MAG: Serine-tRNA ligase [candidate division CPR2 bacterium GW2011_GWC1_39_9]|uniref:Serine--tRNA ligase n=1 Tax=candidate division CPR2 bacterium GW2011_GWC2_39_10 TaxID=1618345 RepID=A0A0G0Q0R1_UNCC2|nr:MAG: Serine-tRNA ligase [candidate division CPR2 bacterium GW2011_GWC2_39_10]KKR34934.1 MAG: Serine-tRNA ligase [candidate division CPR2 bacterium GW2011_GWC1_39_9]
MLDIKFIRENRDLVKKAVNLKEMDVDIDALLELDMKRVELIKEVDNLRSEKKSDKRPSKEEIEKIKKIKEELTKKEGELRKIQDQFEDLMLRVPNIPSPDSPVGDESANKEVSKWGELPKFDFPILDHIELAKNLDLIDFLEGTNVSGFRGYYLKNEAVLLQMALMWMALDKLKRKGFTLMIPPTLVREFALTGSGQFPFAKTETYQVANAGTDKDECLKDPLYLVGTAEPSLLAYNANKILDEAELPIKLCGFSQCYRSEVGSYGKDTRGAYRLHEFMKVEQVILCTADLGESMKWLEQLRETAEEMLTELQLTHRVLSIATGDMGAGKYAMYDLETWMPARNAYGETHSDSNFTDWQTRRLNIRYKTREGKLVHPYALNNTMIASPRILIAIFENYQQKDGSINMPEALVKYLGFDKIIKR